MHEIGFNKLTYTAKYHGKTISLKKLSKITKINYFTLVGRYKKGWRDDQLLVTHIHTVNYKGKVFTISQLAKLLHCNRSTLDKKYKAGIRLFN